MDQGELVDLVLVARTVLDKARGQVRNSAVPAKELPSLATEEILAAIARVHVREGMTDAERWHAKCGHISMKYLKRLGVWAPKYSKGKVFQILCVVLIVSQEKFIGYLTKIYIHIRGQIFYLVNTLQLIYVGPILDL